MKKYFIIRQAFIALFALALTLSFSTASFANPGSAYESVLSHFSGKFKNAENVRWKHTKEFSKASFIRNNQRMEVFYDTDQKFICAATYISLEQLPEQTLQAINDKYGKYQYISVIRCLDANNFTKYYIEMENDKKKIILQSDLEGFVSVFKSEKK